MTSKLYFQDDSIQLIEVSSEKSSTDNLNTIQSPSSLAKLKKKNKIESPTVLSTNVSISSSNSKISDLFVVKQTTEPSKKQLKPIPAPRKIKSSVKLSSKENSASTSVENLGKSSGTLDTLSGDLHSILSQKSETLSYKDRLRNRFLSVKKQAENSVIHRDKTKVHTKKKLKETVETILQNEETELNTELNKYKQQRFDWNTTENSYDFFCREKDKPEEITTAEENNSEENVKQSVSEFLGIDYLDTDLCEFVFPEVADLSQGEILYKLKKNRPKKINNYEFRNFEEEGIYKSKINHISKYQLRIMEDRLFYDETRDWFGPDGQLKILPDPRLKNSFKPFETTAKHSDFINKYTSPTLYEPAENYINIYENTLEIIIHEIKFKHHSLFSEEHVLAQKLINLYDDYKKLTSHNILTINTKKLEALRSAKYRLEQTIQQSGDCNENQHKKHNKYLLELKQTRENIYSQSLKERALKKSILTVWKTIKNLRKSQKYSSTNIKLIITKESVDYNNETEIWEHNLLQETLETLEELENKFEAETIEYKTNLKQWKEQQKQIHDNDEKKPKKPKRHFTEEQIKSEILQKMNFSLKPPGEPNIDFDLNFTNEISDPSNNLNEKLRRTDVCKTKIFVKILCNTREICKSQLVALNDKFICNFNQQFSIKLYNIPHNLILQIYEHTNQISKRLLSEISLSVPDFTSIIHDVETRVEIFNNTEILKHNHSGIGTGIEIDKIINFEDTNAEKLFLTGTLKLKLGWTIDKNIENLLESSLKNPEEHSDLIPTLFDIENLENWIKNYPDPLDPQNVIFFDHIKNLNSENNSEKKYFRVNPEISNLEFCTTDELEKNPRFKLLKLRFNDEPEFKGIVVPNRVKEIPANIFSSYENRRKEEIVTYEILIEQFKEGNNIDSQRKWSRKYLEQAENRIIQLSKIAERKISMKAVLNEEIIPSFGYLGISFMNYLQPKRPLRPTRKQIKSIPNQINFKELNILINIIGAIQVPIRKELIPEQTSSNQNLIISVRPFVTVNFRDETARTTVAEGPNPVWNQELNLVLSNKNENFTELFLQNIKDNIVINLFDETIDDLIIDDRIKDRNIHQQIGCNFLGSFQIPFTSLLYNNRIEGTFKLNLPQILLGYQQSIKTFPDSAEPFSQQNDTFITIFLTLQPAIVNLNVELKCELECTEVQYVEEFITNWQNEYNTLFPQRKFSCFITTLNGEKCCITRLFKEIQLPEEIGEMQLAKYVSLIPFRENSRIIPDIYLAADQLLTLMMGTVKDHCVLLTCYLLTVGLKVWFLLGYSLVDGYTAYVLLRETSVISFGYFIYNVKTGKKYNVYDNNCPLQKVFCVINDSNVWANIQEDDRIHQTTFDFTKSSDWLPLFNKDITAPTNLQQINVNYYDPPSVLLLQERIEKKLRKKIMKWRKFSRTTFNHYCNATVKKILAELNVSENPENLLEIQNLLASYQIRGFAQSFPYTNISDLIDFVQKTGIHLNDNPNIEFSLSVYAHSYNNNAVIIWLFIATLIRKR